MWLFFHKLASPKYFYSIATNFIPWLFVLGAILMFFGIINGLFFAPPDYQQGDAFRIIYVHVPSAYLSMMIYVLMAITSIVGLVWRIKLAHAVTVSAAPIGGMVYFVSLNHWFYLG